AALALPLTSCGAAAASPIASGAPTPAATAVPPVATAAATSTPTPIPPPATPIVSAAPPTTGRLAAVSGGDDFFTPADVTVAVGATVAWQIMGSGERPHNVVAKDKTFVSNDLHFGESFSFTFTKPGKYEYVCSYHIVEGMVGSVTVVA